MIGRVCKLYLGFKVCYVEENECLFLIYYFWIKDDVYIIKIWLNYRNIKFFICCIFMLILCWFNWIIVILFSYIYWDEYRVSVYIEFEFLLLIIGFFWRR